MNIANITFLTEPVTWDKELNKTSAVMVTTVTFTNRKQAEVRQIVERECSVTKMANYFRAIAAGLERFDKEHGETANADQQQAEG